MDDDGDDDDVQDNFECPSLGSNTFLVIYFQTIVINLPSSMKSHNVLRNTEQLQHDSSVGEWYGKQ